MNYGDKKIATRMERHYSGAFQKYGPTSRGVDWGSKLWKVAIRHQKMAELFGHDRNRKVNVLDVGCGYGEFYEFLQKKSSSAVRFTGVDVSEPMVREARKRYPRAEFICDDFMAHNFRGKKFDYITCNGIFTQKLSVPEASMQKYLQRFITKMNATARRGFAFNTMSSHVNFRRRNLFYADPAELLTHILRLVSRHVRIAHGAPPYETICYVYKK